jgi:hypothetical protein
MIKIRRPWTSISFLVLKKDVAMLTVIGCSRARLDTIATIMAVTLTAVGRSCVGLNTVGGMAAVATISGRSWMSVPGWLLLVLVSFDQFFTVFLDAALIISTLVLKDITTLTAIGCSCARLDTIATIVAVVLTTVGESCIGLITVGGMRAIAIVSGRS